MLLFVTSMCQQWNHHKCSPNALSMQLPFCHYMNKMLQTLWTVHWPDRYNETNSDHSAYSQSLNVTDQLNQCSSGVMHFWSKLKVGWGFTGHDDDNDDVCTAWIKGMGGAGYGGGVRGMGGGGCMWNAFPTQAVIYILASQLHYGRWKLSVYV